MLHNIADRCVPILGNYRAILRDARRGVEKNASVRPIDERSLGEKVFRTEPRLIDDFVLWIERRYGFVASGTTPGRGGP